MKPCPSECSYSMFNFILGYTFTHNWIVTLSRTIDSLILDFDFTYNTNWLANSLWKSHTRKRARAMTMALSSADESQKSSIQFYEILKKTFFALFDFNSESYCVVKFEIWLVRTCLRRVTAVTWSITRPWQRPGASPRRLRPQRGHSASREVTIMTLTRERGVCPAEAGSSVWRRRAGLTLSGVCRYTTIMTLDITDGSTGARVSGRTGILITRAGGVRRESQGPGSVWRGRERDWAQPTHPLPGKCLQTLGQEEPPQPLQVTQREKLDFS